MKFTFEGRIGIGLRPHGRSAELTVTDTGTGIPADELPRLFERFHRVERARARSGEGSGIGLAVVRELVGLHGGAIAVDSTPDRGTTFTVTLPLGHEHLPLGPDRAGGRGRGRPGRPGCRRRALRHGGAAVAPGRPGPAGGGCGAGRGAGAGAGRRRQHGHARVPVAAAPLALRGAGGRRRCRGARGGPAEPSRPGRQRRDDARARRAGAPCRPACRLPHRARPRAAALGPRRAVSVGRGPGCGRGRLPRQALLGRGAARARRSAPAARARTPRGRGAVHRHGRPRPGADLGGGPGGHAGVREPGLAAVHRTLRRRARRGLAHRAAPAGPAAVPGGGRGGHRGPRGLGGRVPPAPGGRRVPVDARARRSRRAHRGMGRQLHRHQRAVPGVRAADPAGAVRRRAGERVRPCGTDGPAGPPGDRHAARGPVLRAAARRRAGGFARRGSPPSTRMSRPRWRRWTWSRRRCRRW